MSPIDSLCQAEAPFAYFRRESCQLQPRITQPKMSCNLLEKQNTRRRSGKRRKEHCRSCSADSMHNMLPKQGNKAFITEISTGNRNRNSCNNTCHYVPKEAMKVLPKTKSLIAWNIPMSNPASNHFRYERVGSKRTISQKK